MTTVDKELTCAACGRVPEILMHCIAREPPHHNPGIFSHYAYRVECKCGVSGAGRVTNVEAVAVWNEMQVALMEDRRRKAPTPILYGKYYGAECKIGLTTDPVRLHADKLCCSYNEAAKDLRRQELRDLLVQYKAPIRSAEDAERHTTTLHTLLSKLIERSE